MFVKQERKAHRCNLFCLHRLAPCVPTPGQPVSVTGMTRPGKKKPMGKAALEADALTTRPTRQSVHLGENAMVLLPVTAAWTGRWEGVPEDERSETGRVALLYLASDGSTARVCFLSVWQVTPLFASGGWRVGGRWW